MIYLKKNQDGAVRAFCDAKLMRTLAGAEEADLQVTEEEWAAAGSCAHATPEGIVLGPSPELHAQAVRESRNRKLAASDKYMLPDFTWPDGSPLDPQERDAWTAYRRALRRLPATFGFPWLGPDDPACPWPPVPAQR